MNIITVYVIISLTKKYHYIGITNNFERRLKEHCQTKKSYVPFKVLLTEIFQNYQVAREREKFFKSGQGRKYLDTLK